MGQMKLIFTSILVASCAFAADAGRVAAACGPNAARFGSDAALPEPPEPPAEGAATKAVVYVIADGNPQTTRFGLDGAWVGASQGDSWLWFLVEPGEHHLCADWQPSRMRTMSTASSAKLISLTSFTVEAGKVYYFRVRFTATSLGNIPSNLRVNQPDLEPVNTDEARFLMASYPFSALRLKK
jgi:hypothetical protein